MFRIMNKKSIIKKVIIFAAILSFFSSNTTYVLADILRYKDTLRTPAMANSIMPAGNASQTAKLIESLKTEKVSGFLKPSSSGNIMDIVSLQYKKEHTNRKQKTWGVYDRLGVPLNQFIEGKISYSLIKQYLENYPKKEKLIEYIMPTLIKLKLTNGNAYLGLEKKGLAGDYKLIFVGAESYCPMPMLEPIEIAALVEVAEINDTEEKKIWQEFLEQMQEKTGYFGVSAFSQSEIGSDDYTRVRNKIFDNESSHTFVRNGIDYINELRSDVDLFYSRDTLCVVTGQTIKKFSRLTGDELSFAQPRNIDSVEVDSIGELLKYAYIPKDSYMYKYLKKNIKKETRILAPFEDRYLYFARIGGDIQAFDAKRQRDIHRVHSEKVFDIIKRDDNIYAAGLQGDTFIVIKLSSLETVYLNADGVYLNEDTQKTPFSIFKTANELIITKDNADGISETRHYNLKKPLLERYLPFLKTSSAGKVDILSVEDVMKDEKYTPVHMYLEEISRLLKEKSKTLSAINDEIDTFLKIKTDKDRYLLPSLVRVHPEKNDMGYLLLMKVEDRRRIVFIGKEYQQVPELDWIDVAALTIPSVTKNERVSRIWAEEIFNRKLTDNSIDLSIVGNIPRNIIDKFAFSMNIKDSLQHFDLKHWVKDYIRNLSYEPTIFISPDALCVVEASGKIRKFSSPDNRELPFAEPSKARSVIIQPNETRHSAIKALLEDIPKDTAAYYYLMDISNANIRILVSYDVNLFYVTEIGKNPLHKFDIKTGKELSLFFSDKLTSSKILDFALQGEDLYVLALGEDLSAAVRKFNEDIKVEIMIEDHKEIPFWRDMFTTGDDKLIVFDEGLSTPTIYDIKTFMVISSSADPKTSLKSSSAGIQEPRGVDFKWVDGYDSSILSQIRVTNQSFRWAMNRLSSEKLDIDGLNDVTRWLEKTMPKYKRIIEENVEGSKKDAEFNLQYAQDTVKTIEGILNYGIRLQEYEGLREEFTGKTILKEHRKLIPWFLDMDTALGKQIATAQRIGELKEIEERIGCKAILFTPGKDSIPALLKQNGFSFNAHAIGISTQENEEYFKAGGIKLIALDNLVEGQYLPLSLLATYSKAMLYLSTIKDPKIHGKLMNLAVQMHNSITNSKDGSILINDYLVTNMIVLKLPKPMVAYKEGELENLQKQEVAKMRAA